ncbi:MAG: ECs_2282 family putative zinc-binding protein [Bauldia sp.]
MLNPDKYRMSVSLLCPTCGKDQFKYEEPADTAQTFECENCGRQLTREELFGENQENIHEHAMELGREAVKDISKDFKEQLKRRFANNKYIKIK